MNASLKISDRCRTYEWLTLGENGRQRVVIEGLAGVKNLWREVRVRC